MGKKWMRNCDHPPCGQYYEGYGRRFCSHDCDKASRRGVEEPVPQAPSEDITIKLDTDFGSVTVAGSTSIKTPDELMKRSGIDLRIWEAVPDSGQMKKWDVPMKIDDKAVVIPCHYVAIKVRKKWEHSEELPIPVVLKIVRPLRRKPADGAFVSVHYSDEHFPNHDPAAINILYQIIDFLGPNLTWGHGDTLDCAQLNRWPKDPFNRTPMTEEVRMGAEHLGIIHALTPNAEHGWQEGNHEDNLRRQIWKAMENRVLGEMLSLPGIKEVLEWGNLLGITDLGWETLTYTGAGGENHKLLFDKLILKHGDKTGPAAGSAATRERQMYHKSGLSGHTHRQAYVPRRDYSSTNGWWEIGLLGRIHSNYTAHADWQQGFAVVTWSADRERFGVELVSIHDGVAYFRGKRFEGNARSFGDLAVE